MDKSQERLVVVSNRLPFVFKRDSGDTGYLEFAMNHDGNFGSPAVYNIMRMALPTAVL